MQRWIGLTLLAMLLLVAAFVVSALAVEWRQDDTDLSPLTTQVSGLAADVQEIRSIIEATPTPGPTPLPSPTPTPEPAVARMANGAVVEYEGVRLTVDGYRLGSTEASPRADFTLENVDAAPESTGLFRTVKVVDKDGFVCDSGSMATGGGFETLQPGEKIAFGVYWECRDRIVKTLTLGGGAIIFEFP